MKSLFFFFPSSFVVVKGGDCIVPSWVCCECHMLLGGGSTLLSFLFFFSFEMRLLPAVSRGEVPIRSIVIGEWSAQCKSVDCFSCATFLFFFFLTNFNGADDSNGRRKKEHICTPPSPTQNKSNEKRKERRHTHEKKRKKGLDFLFCASSGKVSCVLSAKVTSFCIEILFFSVGAASPWSWI